MPTWIPPTYADPKAIGILAQPALALQLLWMFRTQTTPQRLMGPRRLALAITTQNYYLLTNAGTQNLSNGPFARRIWKAAAPARQRVIKVG
jgi:hypothetical protein